MSEVARRGPLLELRGIELVLGPGAGTTAASREARPLSDRVLRVEPGTCVHLFGSAGSGKSSLLKVAAGIVPPERGEVLVEGRSLADLSRSEEAAFRRRCGFVFQDAALWSNMSLRDNIAFPLRVHEPGLPRAEVEAAVRRAAEAVGFEKGLEARPSDISVGQHHLIGLARALVLDPDLLFLDEPLASLDETEGLRVIDLVAESRRRGRTILTASGSNELAFRVADGIGVIRAGRMEAWGSYEEARLWKDGALRAVMGSLKPRRAAGDLLGAWEESLAADEGFGSSGSGRDLEEG